MFISVRPACLMDSCHWMYAYGFVVCIACAQSNIEGTVISAGDRCSPIMTAFVRIVEICFAIVAQFSVSDWNFEMMNLLLDAGADTGAADKNGITPLMCCAQV